MNVGWLYVSWVCLTVLLTLAVFHFSNTPSTGDPHCDALIESGLNNPGECEVKTIRLRP